MSRKFRYGSVDEHPKGSGRHRVRVRVDGRQRVIASGLSRAAAEATADAYALVRDAEELRQGITLTQFGAGFLDRREKRGIRSIDEDERVDGGRA